MNYLMRGYSLISTKGLKRFVLIPLFVNLVLFGTAFYFIFSGLDGWINWVLGTIPDFLSWVRDALAWLLWPLALITILVGSALLFGTLANWIAAPFNGLLAEKVEQHLTGQTIAPTSFTEVLKDVPRVLGREFTKLKYYLPRALGYLILFFILPVIGQVIWFLFSAWMMAIQYCDYPFDNHKVGFNQMRRTLGEDKGQSIGFGVSVTVLSMIPIVNFLVMPVAVCGATAMWVDDLRDRVDRQ